MNQLVTSLNQAAESWCSFVLHASWQAAVVGLGVLLVLRFGRRWPAPLRHGLLLIALIKFACPPMVGAPIGVFSRFDSSGWTSDRAAIKNSLSITVPSAATFPTAEEQYSADGTTAPSADTVPTESIANAVSPLPATAVDEPPLAIRERADENHVTDMPPVASRAALNWRAWLMFLHLAGAALLASWTAWQFWLLRRVVIRSRPITTGPYHEQLLCLARQLKIWRTPRLLESPEAVSPMAVGTWRPTVVIPARVLANSSAGDLQTVLAHELAHLRRGDVWINWLRIVLVTAWWFHPVVWLVSRALRRVHEDCCDDLLLVDGLTSDADYCQTLLRVASQISGGASAGMALGMAHRLHPLGDRLLRIMDRAVRRRSRLSLGGLCLLVPLATLLLPGLSRRPVRAAPPNSQEAAAKPGTAAPQVETKAVGQVKATAATITESADSDAVIAGTVSDANARPMAGATVWLLGGKWGDELLTRRAETITDEQGRFSFRQFMADDLFKRTSDQQFPTIIVRDKSRRLGWISNFQAPVAKKIKVKLHEVADLRGQLVDLSGRPIAGAVIRPQSVNALKLQDDGFEGTSLARELAEEWETTTTDDGRFMLSHVPLDGSLTARIRAAGFGNPLVDWNLGKDVALRLGLAGSIVGVVELPAQIVEPSTLTLDLRRQADMKSKGTAFRIDYSASSAVANDRSFEFRDVPPGDYVISLKQERSSPVYGDPTPPIVVPAGERVAGIQLPLRRGMVVRGVAVDNRDKRPLKEVMLRLETLKSNDAGQYVTSDEHGRFTAYVRPGELLIQPWQTPSGYLPALLNGPCETLEVMQDIETTVEVECAIDLEGVVVDEHGRPVDGAELQPSTPWRVSLHGAPAKVRADESGRFTLKDVDPADNLSLRVRSRTAVSDGVVLLRTEQLRKPARVVIRQANACHLIGRVVDEVGNPIRHVKIWLNSHRGDESLRIPRGRSMSTDVFVEELETDDEGRFRSTAVWPRDSYQVVVAVDDYERAESKRVLGKAGETMDVGTIILRRNNGFVGGQVVDSSHRPIEGVTMFNSGDGLQPVSMITDTSGRFRLNGLFGGPVYVFARKRGYRFTGLRAKAGSKDVEVMLLGQDEPPPANQPAPAPSDASPQRQLARWMLEQLWQLPQAENKWVLVRCMARFDPRQAEVWAAQLGKPHEQEVFIGVSERLLDLARQPNLPIDYDEALGVAASLSSQRGCDMLKMLAELIVVRNPERSFQFIEEARLRAGNLGPPQRAALRAQLGGLLVRMGQAQAGRTLIDEAADEAERSPRNWLAAQHVVAALAPYDLPRARRLPDAVVGDPSGRNRLLAELASALATHDLNEALATAAEIKGDVNANSVRNHALMEIAYRLASARREEAAQVVALMDGNDGDKTRAEALGWLAVVMAQRDKKTAVKLIDQSLELLLDHPEAFRSWGNYGGRCMIAAWIARQAREVGYPDMESVVMRVLATRPTMADEFDPIRRVETNIAMALLLNFSAPDVARQVLEVCEPSGQLVGSGHSSIRRGEWIEAWGLADPVRARELVGRELAALTAQDKVNLQRSEVVQAVDLLSLPAAQWPRHFAVDFGAIWFPGEEWMIKWGRLRP